MPKFVKQLPTFLMDKIAAPASYELLNGVNIIQSPPQLKSKSSFAYFLIQNCIGKTF
jgi:hypothetical protein